MHYIGARQYIFRARKAATGAELKKIICAFDLLQGDNFF